jgi:hypothetical protein
MDDVLRDAQARLERYWNVDGLHEIGVALILAMTALWLWATDLSDLPRVWKNAASTTFPLLLCGGIFAEKYVVKAIRRRLTYPRVGFAELRTPPVRGRVFSGVAAAIIALAIAFGMSRLGPAEFRRWVVVVPALLCCAILWRLGSRAGVTRFRAVAALLAASSIAIAGAGLSFPAGLALFWVIAAAAFFVSGGITLWRFLHA